MVDTKKSSEIPVTKIMLESTLDELKFDIASVRHELKSLDHKMQEGFQRLEAKFEIQNAKIDSQYARIDRMLALYEDQNARNVYVLDGYQGLHDRIDKDKVETDERLDRLESVIVKPNKI